MVLQAVHKYELGFITMEQVQRQVHLLQLQCDQMEQKYQATIQQEINRLYDQQLILLQLSRRKQTRFTY